ncbi:hypothetical protein CXG50_12705 [Pseudomonas plecoglossicida]|uniref:Uncharacterized protein n=4 Tax=Pseudomonas TaxID=286 RepID=A0A2A3M9S1_PSEDL|nr:MULTISPECIES: hypothetical protein [Pseudomonas]TXH99899.1 MAG: hypothetical protein E6Q70_24115 [Pseudomonas monteilii]AGA71743.1 hypothetical protein B479_04135 [Pseudomonas putida HB3267]KPM63223.1 hypothetical protein HB13667_15280 [Pseudomonas putida]KYC18427.1 hypothetical protein WM94_20390 [Pseudomonas sp. ABFPK]MBA6112912.1 hypothetical protein [Pseudomonas asiatica]
MDVFSFSTLIVAASGAGFMDFKTRRGDFQRNTYIGVFFDQVGSPDHTYDLNCTPHNLSRLQVLATRRVPALSFQ